ncbi:MAG: nucleotidyltransferase family protein [Patescibacteria group bacterium]
MDFQTVRHTILPIAQKARARRVALFGSVARGDAGVNSDVDVLIDLPRPYGLFSFLALKSEMEDALGRQVDLIAYDTIKPAIRDRVLKEAVPII